MSQLSTGLSDGETGHRSKQAAILADYLTEAELAQELNLTTRTLSSWREQRCGPPSTKVARRVIYRRDSVRAWLKAQEIEPVRSHRRSA